MHVLYVCVGLACRHTFASGSLYSVCVCVCVFSFHAVAGAQEPSGVYKSTLPINLY